MKFRGETFINVTSSGADKFVLTKSCSLSCVTGKVSYCGDTSKGVRNEHVPSTHKNLGSSVLASLLIQQRAG